MQRAGTETRQLAVIVAGEHVIVGVAKHEAEIGRRAGLPDLHAADMDDRICRHVEKERAPSRLRKHVGDAAVLEQPVFLPHQRVERPPAVVGIGAGLEADLARGRQTLALDTVAAPRGRRTLRGVKRLPVAAQVRDMRSAWIGRDGEIKERIVLAADRLRHFLELDPGVMRHRIAPQPHAKFVPGGDKTVARDALGEIGRQQRRVVIVQILAEPAEPRRDAPGLDGQRPYEGSRPVGKRSDSDRGTHAVAQPDVPLPRGEPIERLERRAVRNGFEPPPLRRHGIEIVKQRQVDARRRLARGLRPTRRRITAPVQRQTRAAQCRQWCGTCHESPPQ